MSMEQLEPLNVTSITTDGHHHWPTFALFLPSNDNAAFTLREDNDSASDNPGRFSEALSKIPLLYGADGMMYVIITSYDATSSMISHKTSFVKSPQIIPSPRNNKLAEQDCCGRLVGSLVQKEGHVYSLAVSGDLLYTGSDSKNIRAWKNFEEFSRFKSNSGLVKTIVISGDLIFTGHQDGKIRIWTNSSSQTGNVHKGVGSLPTWQDQMKSLVKYTKSYVEVRRHRKELRIRHVDAVSCLGLDEEAGIMYSGSWDKSVKVWRIADSRCMESVNAHDDAVNTVLAMGKGLVLTGSAEATVKAWRREFDTPNTTQHVMVKVLLSQESAVTSLAVNSTSDMVYCGSSDGVVNFWTVTRGRETRHGGMLWGHRMAVLCLATGGSRLVFSGSADKSVRVWMREREGSSVVHTCLGTLTGHAGPIKCLTVVAEEEDGSTSSSDEGDPRWRAYSGSLDGSVRVWSVADNQHVLRTWQKGKTRPERTNQVNGRLQVVRGCRFPNPRVFIHDHDIVLGNFKIRFLGVQKEG